MSEITTWNFRIVGVKVGDNTQWGIYEVYYRNGQPISRSEEPIAAAGNSVKEVKRELKLMRNDAKKRGPLSDSEIGRKR
jgi:DNA-directed RNA polymerase specialized sigma54-like protein